MPLPFLPKCPDSRQLSLANQDRALSWVELAKLTVHKSYCRACSAFDTQLDETQKAMRAWRSYHEQDK